MSTKSLPQIKRHIDGVVNAEIAVRNNSLASDAVVGHGDDLCAEGVVLSGAKLVKDAGGHGDQGHAGVDLVGKVGAEAAGAELEEQLAGAGWVAEHEDGAVLVGARGDVAGLDGGSRGGGQGQHGGGDGERELHPES